MVKERMLLMPTDDALTFSPQKMNERQMYKLMIGSIVPRPIAWVSTISEKGVLNIAPFSFFSVVSRQPATLSVTITPEKEDNIEMVKDTLANIRGTKEFVVNIVPELLANEMHETSKKHPSHINEFDKAHLTPIQSKVVSPPSVKESPIAFECRLDQIIKIGSDHLVLGAVQRVRIEEEVYLGNYKIDAEKLKPLARMGKGYASLSTLFNLPR